MKRSTTVIVGGVFFVGVLIVVRLLLFGLPERGKDDSDFSETKGNSHSETRDSSHNHCKNKLQGSWHNKLFQVRYNWPAGRTTSWALGEKETKPLRMVECSTRRAVFKSGDRTLVATFEKGGAITLSGSGTIPLRMKRLPD